MKYTVEKDEEGRWCFTSINKKFSIIQRKCDGWYLPYVENPNDPTEYTWTEDYCRTLDECETSMMNYKF